MPATVESLRKMYKWTALVWLLLIAAWAWQWVWPVSEDKDIASAQKTAKTITGWSASLFPAVVVLFTLVGVAYSFYKEASGSSEPTY